MIAMLSHSELDTEVLDIDMETAKSDDCREMSRDNRNTNGMLAVIQEEVRFFHKDRQKFINLFT